MAQYKTPSQPRPWENPEKRARQLREAIEKGNVKNNEVLQQTLELLEQITQFERVQRSA